MLRTRLLSSGSYFLGHYCPSRHTPEPIEVSNKYSHNARTVKLGRSVSGTITLVPWVVATYASVKPALVRLVWESAARARLMYHPSRFRRTLPPM
jgi:hypothetical protein